jgi:hypothetical protein
VHFSPLSSTKHHQLTQKSRNHMAIRIGPIIFERPGNRDFKCEVQHEIALVHEIQSQIALWPTATKSLKCGNILHH